MSEANDLRKQLPEMVVLLRKANPLVSINYNPEINSLKPTQKFAVLAERKL